MAEFINIPYAEWKSLVNSNGWTTYYRNTPETETTIVYSGTADKIIKGLAKNISSDKSQDGSTITDWTDWDTNFSGSAVAVSNDEELLLKILQATFPSLEVDPSIANLSVNISGEQIEGKSLRYEKQGNVDLPKSSEAFATVYEITTQSVFYKILFQLDSDNIYIQVEVDGQDIFPAGNGLKFEDLESLCLGTSGNNYYGGGGGGGELFGLYQYDSNKWIWEPPRPIYVQSSLKVKMKASNSSTSKDCLNSIAIRRGLG